MAERRVIIKNAKGEQIVGILRDTASEVKSLPFACPFYCIFLPYIEEIEESAGPE